MKSRLAKILASVVLALSLIVGTIAAVAGLVMESNDVYNDGGIYFREEVAEELFQHENGTALTYAYRLSTGNISDTQRARYEAKLSRENTNLAIEVVTENGLEVILTNYETGAYLYEFESYILYNDMGLLLRAYLQKDLSAKDSFAYVMPIVDFFIAIRTTLIWIVIFCGLIALSALIFLLCAAGHRRGTEGIYRTWFDRVPLEIVVTAYFLMFWFTVQAFDSFRYQDGWTAVGIISFGILWVVLTIFALLTLAVRLKSHTFLKNTLTWRLLKLIWRGVCLLGRVLGKLPLYWKTALGFTFFSFFEFLALAVGRPQMTAFWFLTRPFMIAFLIYAVLMLRRLQRAGEQLASGNTDYKVDTTYMPPDFKRHGENLNNLSDGLNHAVEERMKSERMKAELITNVSHDIKTPLTSIVSYVDLLKTGGLDSPDAPQYLEVLEQQSARLKKLTEDLIEASKASSGCIAVNAEKTDVNVLLSQALGEHEETLRKAGIEPILRPCEETAVIFADGRLLWRVFDNLFSNIRKYAQPGTRAYFTAEIRDGRVEIAFRNISAVELPVTGEELTERFVRGDASRHTEGSGLGLSIARSLTELQGGTFGITVDGDLFKATVSFPLA